MKNDKTIKDLKESTRNILKWRYSQATNELPAMCKLKLFFVFKCLFYEASDRNQNKSVEIFNLNSLDISKINPQKTISEASLLNNKVIFYFGKKIIFCRRNYLLKKNYSQKKKQKKLKTPHMVLVSHQERKMFKKTCQI